MGVLVVSWQHESMRRSFSVNSVALYKQHLPCSQKPIWQVLNRNKINNKGWKQQKYQERGHSTLSNYHPFLNANWQRGSNQVSADMQLRTQDVNAHSRWQTASQLTAPKLEKKQSSQSHKQILGLRGKDLSWLQSLHSASSHHSNNCLYNPLCLSASALIIYTSKISYHPVR